MLSGKKEHSLDKLLKFSNIITHRSCGTTGADTGTCWLQKLNDAKIKKKIFFNMIKDLKQIKPVLDVYVHSFLIFCPSCTFVKWMPGLF